MTLCKRNQVFQSNFNPARCTSKTDAFNSPNTKIPNHAAEVDYLRGSWAANAQQKSCCVYEQSPHGLAGNLCETQMPMQSLPPFFGSQLSLGSSTQT